ncbi:hypothetical protein JS73_11060 [Synergistes jonesii]|uniref:Uncharacterized protein n=1 Tax=Synergistes jonesii TaxID=2754 RepID=A0A073IM99_9BACT|nr:hypothetical protein EH55_09600 [Synergistes jonesii]OFB60510.1 hypothetical protein JS73_11060 [Synergistes jonesii]OFB61520.1 hypothetical protein JS79_11215 [Synergistes jonesii]OFB64490.1 hypothetical protein JS72_04375 [Synergistes jonesii]OFB66688.1 hypothetical protein JS78_11085 [Synergistes jonesii]
MFHIPMQSLCKQRLYINTKSAPRHGEYPKEFRSRGYSIMGKEANGARFGTAFLNYLKIKRPHSMGSAHLPNLTAIGRRKLA